MPLVEKTYMTKSNTPLAAILGGAPAVTEDHAKANKWPQLTADDEQAVLQVIHDGNISTHPVIRELEQAYQSYTSQPYVLAHNNGTSALLAAFFALNLTPGDEIIVPSATFWASVSPMLWVGLVPIFCDSESERLGIDPQAIEKLITPRTKAIVVVHLWGLPCKMTEIYAIAKKYNLKIIEDASHAHGAMWRDQKCGTLGDISIFSLQGDKLAPAGEGGIFMTPHYEYYERAITLGDITRIIELNTPARRFAVTSFGIKTRIAPLCAAIGKVQLQKLDANNQKRNENLIYLSKHLEPLGFDVYLPPSHIHRVYFEFIIRYKQNASQLPFSVLMDALTAEGCKVSAPRYLLLHQQPFFTEGQYKFILRNVRPENELPDYSTVSLPTIESEKNLLKLPSFPVAEKKILDQYILAFEKVISQSASILKKWDPNLSDPSSSK
jgi:perosamine synthetase